MSLDNDTIIVFDRGSYIFLAQALGRKAKKVYFCRPDGRPYPETHLAQIGEDLPEIEVITGDEFFKYKSKCDWIALFDCYDMNLQQSLRDEGIPVFGSGGSAKMELDRIYFKEMLEELNLPMPHTEVKHGITETLKYLEKSKGVKYLKGSRRGDFETKRYSSILQIMPWVNELKSRIGEMAEEIDILIQDEIKAECEVGSDSFNLNGVFTGNPIVGYEIKDKGFIGKIMSDYPDPIDYVLEKIAPKFEELGCWGNFSNELRIEKDGTVNFTDSTNRCPSPPGHLFPDMYSNFEEGIRNLAHGEMPKFKKAHTFGAEFILHSYDHEKSEVYVTFPKDVEPFVKLINHTKEGDGYYVIPNDNGGYFGGVVGLGDSVEEAIENCKAVMDEIEADGLDYDPAVFDSAQEQIEAGERFGIKF